MPTFMQLSVTAALAGALLCPAAARAQTDNRPTVAVVDFDASPGGWTIPPPRVGETVAKLLLDRLVNADRFRVLDGQWLRIAAPDRRIAHETLLANARDAGVDFVVLGSITEFSMERRHQNAGGAGFLRRAPGLGAYRRDTSNLAVSLLANIVDVRTGEVIASATGNGVGSRSHISLGALLLRLPFGGALSSGASDSRDAQLQEATRRAVDAASVSLLNSAHRLLQPR